MSFDYEVLEVRRVLDGDTYDLVLSREFDVGFNFTSVWRGVLRIRLVIVDTPEKGTDEYAAAIQHAKGFLADARRILRCRTFKPKSATADGGFGRWLGDIYDVKTGDTLAGELLRLGYMEYRRGR